jgi:hypothetical protein
MILCPFNEPLLSEIISKMFSGSARHRSQDIVPPVSQIVLKNFIKISWIIKECPEGILLKLAIVLKYFSVAETLLLLPF